MPRRAGQRPLKRDLYLCKRALYIHIRHLNKRPSMAFARRMRVRPLFEKNTLCWNVKRSHRGAHVMYLQKRTCICKRAHASAKEHYICIICTSFADTCALLPYICTKKPCISSKASCIFTTEHMYLQKRTCICQRSHVSAKEHYICKRALYMHQKALHILKSVVYIHNRALCIRKRDV